MVIEWTSIGTFRNDAADRAAREAREGFPRPLVQEEKAQGRAKAPEARVEPRSSDTAADNAMDRYASGEDAAFPIEPSGDVWNWDSRWMWSS